jgi:putative Ca2+/H+ antiporter (TMEM165/GDT1 family)
MRHDKWKCFFPAITTMVGLHLSSVALGMVFPLLFSQKVIIYFSVVLFIFFGAMMLWDAYKLEPEEAGEKIKNLEEELIKGKDAESGDGNKHGEAKDKLVTNPDKNLPEENKAPEGMCSCFLTNPYLHLILLLFVGECGDRTQIAAIVLTATHSAWGVAVGGSIVLMYESIL